MFVLQTGAVRLHKAIDGQDTTVANLVPGDFCGEVGVVVGGPQPVSATATEPTRCITVKADALEQMVTSEAEIGATFILGLARRLRDVHEVLGVLARRDAETRIVGALIRHCAASQPMADGGVWVPHRLSDLARETAVSLAELGEVSKRLVKLKLIRSERNGLLVPDMARLHEHGAAR